MVEKFNAMKTIVFFIILICFVYNSSLIYSQNGKDQTYPNGYVPALDSISIKQLKDSMSAPNPDWNNILKSHFKNIYDPALPDLICYIKEDTAIIALVQGGEIKKELFGERFIWILIFSDYDLSGIRTYGTVDLNVLAHQPEPSEYTIHGLLKTISSFIFGSSIETGIRAQAFEDSTINIKLTKHSDKKITIYTFMTKLEIGLNTKNRIVIRPPTKSAKKRFQFINYNFGNFEKSRFGVSLGFGVSTGIGSILDDKLTDADRISLYVFGNYHFCRPRLPVDRKSFSVTLGTNFITGKFLQNIILGIRSGWLNPVGIIFGVNWISVSDDSRKLHIFLGLDYRL